MPQRPCVLTINGGSSSIKFALYTAGRPPQKRIGGQIERIGQGNAMLNADGQRVPVEASDHVAAAGRLIDWLAERVELDCIAGIGHRVVHGGLRVVEHQVVDDALLEELRRARPLDLPHLPLEIALVETMAARFPQVPQVACLDTAFHRGMPRVAQLLPIPRRYDEAGMRRLGFHGLSYQYLMSELRRIGGDEEATGRIILAHLGNGASMAAVKDGRPVDTSMGLTPTAGLVMGTRPGDLDGGLLVYLMREQRLSLEEADELINRRCGLIGISETSANMRDLLARRPHDVRAAEAVELFCYQARKWIGAFAAALGGLDTLVFCGGIGENAPEVREGICRGLEFLGLTMDPQRNARSEAIISASGARVRARVIQTDEQIIIAESVCNLLRLL